MMNLNVYYVYYTDVLTQYPGCSVRWLIFYIRRFLLYYIHINIHYLAYSS